MTFSLYMTRNNEAVNLPNIGDQFTDFTINNGNAHMIAEALGLTITDGTMFEGDIWWLYDTLVIKHYEKHHSDHVLDYLIRLRLILRLGITLGATRASIV